jgi:hypothetical protein
LKKFVFISLSLLLILVTSCITVQTPAPNPITPSVPASVIIFDPNSGKGSVMGTEGTPSVMGNFSSNPSTINSGGTTSLSWNMTGANSVSIDQGIGQVAVAGTMLVSPTASTIYTISATNAAGTVTRSTTTTVVNSSPPTPAPGTFSVIGATANTEPASPTGCFNLYANITANDAGTVTYIWESVNGGGYSYTWNVTFPAAGTQKVTLPAEMRALPSGPYQIHILTPNDLVSNSTQYITCP